MFDEYLSLPFNYLSFAMLDEIDQGGDNYYDFRTDRKFDSQAFTYFFNR